MWPRRWIGTAAGAEGRRQVENDGKIAGWKPALRNGGTK
jgi:hypothetical protein